MTWSCCCRDQEGSARGPGSQLEGGCDEEGARASVVNHRRGKMQQKLLLRLARTELELLAKAGLELLLAEAALGLLMTKTDLGSPNW